MEVIAFVMSRIITGFYYAFDFIQEDTGYIIHETKIPLISYFTEIIKLFI